MSRKFQSLGAMPAHLNSHQPKTKEAARNQRAALRRKSAPKTEKLDDGLMRFLKADAAVEETLRRAGL